MGWYIETDELGQLSLTVIINYMQDFITFQSEEARVGVEYLDTGHRAVLLSSWRIMIDRYPNVEIYFLLNSGLKEEFNESVRATCKHYGIDCIELHDIDKQSGHPSVKGMEQICDQIENFILKKDKE